MDDDRIGLVRIGRDFLVLLCVLDFVRFVNAPAGDRPAYAGAAFLGFALYSIVLYRPLTVSARLALDDGGDGPAYPELWFNNRWAPMIPASFVPWVFALVAGGFGIAMVLA